ncbi:hypothetical protein ZWY2020_010860, partial [Hordeum vulgare]
QFAKERRVIQKSYPVPGTNHWFIETASLKLDSCLIIYAMLTWRHYLLGNRCEIYTDHQSLNYKFSSKQQRGLRTCRREGYQLGGCRVCKHEIAVCRDAQGPPCHVGIPITRLYRSNMVSYIHRIEPDATQGDINSWTAYFFTFERLQYEVTFQYDDLATKIVGEGWQQLLDDYAVCPGDMMYIYMSNGGYNLSVDIKRDGVQQIPLTMRGLSRRKKKIINKCIITRGIELEYSKIAKMIRNVFGPTKSLCCVLVHRISKCDVSSRYMRIPKKVVQRIEKKTGILEEEGQLMLFHDVDAYVDARYKKLTDERLVLQGGFRTYAHLLGLKIDDLVSNFFEKVEDPAAIKVWFTVIS